MTVTLTSPVLGKPVGDTYTGSLEDWLLANGYARRDGYTGPGVANTGAVDVAPSADPTLASNREAPYWPLDDDLNATIANDSTNLTKTSFPHTRTDFDPSGVNDDPPVLTSLAPASGPAAGGTVVTLTGTGFEGVTGVTFGGTAGTALTVVSDTEVTVTTPAGVAGAADVVVTNPNGTDTETGGFTYTA